MHRFGEKKSSLSLPLFIESIVRDLRVGLRTIVAKPGFTLLIVLSLGIGIGANTAIFSVIDGILLRPAAIPRAQDLITVDTAASHATRFGDSSYLDYLDYARQTQALSGVLFKSTGVPPLRPCVSDRDNVRAWHRW